MLLTDGVYVCVQKPYAVPGAHSRAIVVIQIVLCDDFYFLFQGCNNRRVQSA